MNKTVTRTYITTADLADAGACSDQFAIMCVSDNDLFWSNEFGWVDTPTFDLFSEEEKSTLNLPLEGQWVQMTWNENA